MDGTPRLFMVLSVPVYTMAYDPKTIRWWLKSGFGLPSIMLDGLMVSETPFLLGNALSHFVTDAIKPCIINLV